MCDFQVWGVGNVLLGDDAVGCRVAELLAESGGSENEVSENEVSENKVFAVDCGTTPENYLAALRKNPPRTLLIVDAADMGLPPGECRKLSLDELAAVADSSHGVPLPLLLAPFADSIEIAVLGIQPSSLRLGTPLSDTAEKAARRVAESILRNEWRAAETLAVTAR
jgi:hydrogenase 3 maturation protease